MKHYYVTLKIYLGEYEKTTSSLVIVQEGGREEAKRLALEAECHNPPEEGMICNGLVWDDGMAYRVDSCIPVAPEDVRVLKKYVSY